MLSDGSIDRFTDMLFLLLGIITVVCTLAQDTSIELGIISCDQSRTYQDYDVNCLAGGTGVISCNDPLWGYFSPLSPPPDTCEVGTDRRPFGALTLEAQADFWIEIVKMPPDMQAGANETMVRSLNEAKPVTTC